MAGHDRGKKRQKMSEGPDDAEADFSLSRARYGPPIAPGLGSLCYMYARE